MRTIFLPAAHYATIMPFETQNERVSGPATKKGEQMFERKNQWEICTVAAHNSLVGRIENSTHYQLKRLNRCYSTAPTAPTVRHHTRSRR